MASLDDPLYEYAEVRLHMDTWSAFSQSMRPRAEDVLEVDCVPGDVRPTSAFFILPPPAGYDNVVAVGKLLMQFNWRRTQEHVVLQVFLMTTFLPANERAKMDPLSRIELSGMPKVVETMQIWRGSKNDLKRLAFVFSSEEVLECGIEWFGISNVFLCRYRFDMREYNGGGLSVRPYTPAFYTNGKSFAKKTDLFNAGLCYHNRMWKGIVTVQETVRKCLNVCSQTQRMKQTKKVGISNECWLYIKSLFAETVNCSVYDTQTIRQVVYNGAKRMAVSTKHTTELLRFETVQQLESFACVFGRGSVFGIRSRRPKKGNIEHLKESEIFNVVVGKEIVEEDPINRRTSNDGIDLVFNGDMLSVVARYSKYIFRRSVVTGDA